MSRWRIQSIGLKVLFVGVNIPPDGSQPSLTEKM